MQRETVAATAVAIALLGGTLGSDPDPVEARGSKRARPNIVVVMTDDQQEDSIRFMPKLQRLIGDRGTRFVNSFVSYSFCCPSRTTFLTGQYAKNHGVLTNEPPLGGYQRLVPTLVNTLPVWLQAAGYRTAHVGHVVNGYPGTSVPPGWSEWYGTREGGGAYGYLLNENGTGVKYGSGLFDENPANYQTDVLSAKASDFIQRAPEEQPFFLSVAPFAPHLECGCPGDPRAAPRHEGAFAGEPLPTPPSYNEADTSDKPELTRSFPPFNAQDETDVIGFYRNRLESLLAVDDMIESLVATLRARGELKDTVFVFTSDNGFLQGEHRWKGGKVLPYEPSIRVPLLIRGPGVPKGATRAEQVSNVDLAPTILALARARAGRPQDGRSLLPLFGDRQLRWGRSLLLEAHFNAGGEYPGGARIVFNGLRTPRYTFAIYENGERELYDLRRDPFELRSRDGDKGYAKVEASLERLLNRLLPCAGRGCRARPRVRLRIDRRGPSCRGLVARFSGADAKQVIASRIARGKGRRIVVTATLLDGRKLSLSRRVRACPR